MREATSRKRAFEEGRIFTCELTQSFFKKKVRQLQKHLKKLGYDAKMGELYDAVAIMHGYRDWNTMRAIGFEDRPKTEQD